MRYAEKEMKEIVLATRGSKLALAQAEMVQRKLEALGVSVRLSIVKTLGDKDLQSPLSKIGGKGLFVKEIERHLIEGKADIAVHSAKDLPYSLCDGLTIGATPFFEDDRDCIVIKKDKNLQPGAIVGTGSLRRSQQLSRIYEGLEFKDIRGNIDTRINKLISGEYDAICLAMAGIKRLGIDKNIDIMKELDILPLSVEQCIPSACQGILAVECREADEVVKNLLKKISDENVRLKFDIEREIFIGMNADCSMAVGVNATIDEKFKVREKNAEGRITIKALYNNNSITVSGVVTEKSQLINKVIDKLTRQS